MSSGDAAQVTCLVSSGDKPLDIAWAFEGENVSALPGVSTTRGGGKASMLLIDPVAALHGGNYTCTARNPAGIVNFTASLRINGNLLYFPILALPKIVPFSFDDPMSSGDAAQVICSVSSGDQPLQFSWSFNGESVAALPGVSTMGGGRKATILLIDPLHALHRGNYTCAVSNSAGIANYTAELRINGNFFKSLVFIPVMPKVVPFSFDDPMSSGDAAQVTCSVSSGDQPLKFSWSFEGKDVAAVPGVSTMGGGRKASMLIIDPLGALHRGNYTCTVSNRAGVSNYTAELRINGKPF